MKFLFVVGWKSAYKVLYSLLNYPFSTFSRPEICKIKFSKTLPAYKIFNSSLLAGRKSFHRRLFFCLQQIESSFYSFLYAQNFTTLYNSVYSSLLICKILILVGKKSATQTPMCLLNYPFSTFSRLEICNTKLSKSL